MTTVTIAFTNSRNQQETGTFEIVRRNEVSRQQRYELIDAGYDSVIGEDLADEDVAIVEKQAAAAAGLTSNEAFYVRSK